MGEKTAGSQAGGRHLRILGFESYSRYRIHLETICCILKNNIKFI